MEVNSEQRTKLLAANDCYMIGMLATNEEYYPSMGDEQEVITTLKGSNNLMFYVRPLSLDPQPIAEIIDPNISNPMYVGIDTDQNNVVITMGYRYSDHHEKKRILKEKLNDKLIIFKTKVKFSKEERPYKNLIIENIESDIKPNRDMEFIPIPVLDMNNADFEYKLKNSNSILLEDYNHAMYSPEYIICKDYLYTNFPEWTKDSSNPKGWICERYSETIKRKEFIFLGNEIRVGDHIVFVNRQELFKFESEDGWVKITDKLLGDDEKSVIKEDKIESNTFNLREFSFLEKFRNYTLKNRLCYPYEDLVNLHICVKTNPLTILAGMSGTGKTELANYYAQMLNATEANGTLLFLPINPSYTEPGDILGYLNTTTGLYVPSETRLLDILIHAKNNPDKLHVVIFDEMNLSQVEYWFAPFISLLERRAEERRLYLYSSNAYCINKQTYPESVLVGDNIKFIGTVNVDETTKEFSDRLLDRANIINLNKVQLNKFREEINGIKLNNDENEERDKEFSFKGMEDYSKWSSKGEWIEAYSENEIKFLDELHILLNKCDNQKGVSFRVSKKIGEYLINIPVSPKGELLISRNDAVDFQIKQRIVTKIIGSEKQYGKLIGKLADYNNKIPEDSELYDFFNSELAQKISSFSKTKEEIVKKSREMSIFGYAN